MLTGAALFSGFYLNELLMKLLARHDPHPALFDAYAATLAALGGADEARGQAALRAFELVLLRRSACCPTSSIETATQRPVRRRRALRVLADAGVVARAGRDDAGASGATLVGAAGGARRAATSRRCSESPRGALAELRPHAARAASLSSRLRSCARASVMIEAQALTPAST